MRIEIKIPAMGESVAQATVSAILKPSGSYVKADEEIVELETDKVNQVLYAPQAGTLTLTIAKDQTVKIGQVIGYVETDAKAPVAEAKVPPSQAPATPKPTEGPTSRIMAPEFVAGLKEKEPQPAPPPPPAPAPAPAAIKSADGKSTRKKMSNLRKVIAERLVQAKNSTAMLTTFNEIDMTAVMEIRAREKENFLKKHGVRLGFMSFFIKAVVHALKSIPQVNASIDGEDIITYQTYDIGVAVSTERGLMVPVVRNADQLSFGEIEKALEEYAKRARSGSISVDELKGGTFTITNGGVFGSLLSTPILNPPQSAILGMHTIVKRPVALGEQVVIRPMMYVALSYDHRIIDGREAVLFLVQLKATLEEPARLLLDL